MSKTLKKSLKRINKTNEEIKSTFQQQERINHMKDVVKAIFPKIEGIDTIYDAQTVVNALSGFITAHLQKKILDIKLKDIDIDLSNEEDSQIKTAILEIIETNQEESAEELSKILEKFGQALSQFSATKFMKQPMSEITIKDIVA